MEADEDACYSASTAGSNNDTRIFLYEAACPSAESDVECMKFNDDSGDATTSRILWKGKSGTEYKIAVIGIFRGGLLELNVSVRLHDVS